MTATLTLQSTANPIELTDRVANTLNHPVWEKVRGGFKRSIVELAQTGLSKVDTTALVEVLDWFDGFAADEARFQRVRQAEHARFDVVKRGWFKRYAQQNPEQAAKLQTPLKGNASNKQASEVFELVRQAKAWAQKGYDLMVERVTKSRTAVMGKPEAMNVFKHVNTAAHQTIASPLGETTNYGELDQALRVFWSWIKGDDTDAAVLRMGLGNGQQDARKGPSREAQNKRRARQEADKAYRAAQRGNNPAASNGKGGKKQK